MDAEQACRLVDEHDEKEPARHQRRMQEAIRIIDAHIAEVAREGRRDYLHVTPNMEDRRYLAAHYESKGFSVWNPWDGGIHIMWHKSKDPASPDGRD